MVQRGQARRASCSTEPQPCPPDPAPPGREEGGPEREELGVLPVVVKVGGAGGVGCVWHGWRRWGSRQRRDRATRPSTPQPSAPSRHASELQRPCSIHAPGPLIREVAAHRISREVSDVTAARAVPTAVADAASSALLLPREGELRSAASNFYAIPSLAFPSLEPENFKREQQDLANGSAGLATAPGAFSVD